MIFVPKWVSEKQVSIHLIVCFLPLILSDRWHMYWYLQRFCSSIGWLTIHAVIRSAGQSAWSVRQSVSQQGQIASGSVS